MHQGKIGSFAIFVESARGAQHPPVIVNKPLKPGQGVLPAGLLLQSSPSGEIPWDSGGGASISGVLDQEVDTGARDSGLVIIHGSVIGEALKIGAVDPETPGDETLSALMRSGIFPE